MTVFVDASAMVAIMTNEPEAFELERRFGAVDDRLCSALSIWETVRAIARKRDIAVAAAQADVNTFVADFALRLVTIGNEESDHGDCRS